MNSQNIAGFTDKQVLFYSSSSISIFTPEPGRAVSVGKNEKSSICQLENDFSAKLDENLLPSKPSRNWDSFASLKPDKSSFLLSSPLSFNPKKLT